MIKKPITLIPFLLALCLVACSSLSEKDLQQLASSNDVVKMRAIQKIAERQNFPLDLISSFSSRAMEKKAVTKMLELLHSEYESEDIKLSILDALSVLSKSTEVPMPSLVAMIEDRSLRIRLKTVECLGKMRDKRAVPELLTLLEMEENQHSVIWALGEIGDKRAVPVLNKLLNSSNKYTRYNAKKALQKIG